MAAAGDLEALQLEAVEEADCHKGSAQVEPCDGAYLGQPSGEWLVGQLDACHEGGGGGSRATF